MKIALDSNVFTTQRYGGVSRYLVRLSEELILDGNEVEIHGLLHVNRHLAESSQRLTRMHAIDSFPPLTRRAIHFLNDLWMELGLKTDPPDLIHESYCHTRRVGGKSIPRVVTIHDMIHEIFPEYIGKMDRTLEYRLASIRRADAVICVSESTRHDLLRLTGIDDTKVHVVHHGFENTSTSGSLSADENQIVEATVFGKPYVLYVGGREGYKNFEGFLHGFARSAAKGVNRIVAFGGGGFTRKELDFASSLGISKQFLVQLAGSDAMLQKLYANAVAFVYPSLYEGFGFPPLEAMAAGCPVVSSETSCMPEVIGDAAEFFDPRSPGSICEAIDKVLESESTRRELVSRGERRLAEFSWKKCANQTMAIYRSVA